MQTGNIATDQLRSFVERIEKLNDEKAAIAAHIKDVYAEAKASGFVPAGIKHAIKLRAMSKNERDEKEYILSTYEIALGLAGGEDAE